MRVFLGVELSGVWREALDDIRRRVVSAAPALASEKWVPPENLHVTVQFLGELAEEDVQRLADELHEGLAVVTAHELLCDSALEAVPSARRATLLWSRFADPSGGFERLVRTAEGVTARRGVAPDDRDLKPHVTIARLRRPRRVDIDAVELGGVLAGVGAVPAMSVAGVTLYSSIIGGRHPRYERLARIGLAD